jgi:hypothetical protein
MKQISTWRKPPQMNTGAPEPAIHVMGNSLLLAYLASEQEWSGECEEFAVVEFTGVLQHIFGYPNDEALGGHPLYSKGLDHYAFNEILDSPYLEELGARNALAFPGTETQFKEFHHWVVTFHDETLEVIGSEATVRGRFIATTAQQALSQYVT